MVSWSWWAGCRSLYCSTRLRLVVKAKVIDYGKDSLLVEFVQTATKNDAVVKLMKEEFKSIEVVRGGSVGIESISMMER